MQNTFVCPHCGKDVELTQAITHEFEESFRQKSLQELEKERQRIQEETQKKMQEKFELIIKSSQEEAEENRKRNKELQEQILELTRQLRGALEEKQSVRLEMEKRLIEEQDKIRQKAIQDVSEQQRLKIKEYELRIEGLTKSLDEAQRKASQGSQQTQGEALELEFEEILKTEFPNDVVEEVKKGVRGGDLQHLVYDKYGNFCGTILWEFKNTANWSDGWIDKLKQDQREIKAEFSMLVTEVLPKEIKSAGYKNGVWVTTRRYALVMAVGLRATLIQVCQVKKAVAGKDEKMENLHEYFFGTGFKHRMEALLESFNGRQQELEKEKRFFATKWAREEKSIRTFIDNLYGLRGDLEGITRESLPEIKSLELLSKPEGNT